jgi:hypothetical protein
MSGVDGSVIFSSIRLVRSSGAAADYNKASRPPSVTLLRLQKKESYRAKIIAGFISPDFWFPSVRFT